MKIAFYAPLKSPDHPVPSGDRRVARALFEALELAGHEVQLASNFRSYDGGGDAKRQQRLADLADRLAERLIGAYARDGKPDLWFTYHLYHKAPDRIGPRVAEALGIPYVVAEASHAEKQRGGPWGPGFETAEEAIRQARHLFTLNPTDRAGLIEAGAEADRISDLAPFLATEPFRMASLSRDRFRTELARTYPLPEDKPWLLAVAMMRPGDKQASFNLLSDALALLLKEDWHLLVVGDGEAREDIMANYARLGDRVYWFGEKEGDDLAELYAAADLYVWPAINEAFGMAFLEAQAAGLPVIAGRSGGVPSIVKDLETGILTEPGHAPFFAQALRSLLNRPAQRRAMAEAARRHAWSNHDIEMAAGRLDRILSKLVA
ncbi:MAG: glycosyltransferase family 4 protein [Magnetovibrionaceae bacterium]